MLNTFQVARSKPTRSLSQRQPMVVRAMAWWQIANAWLLMAWIVASEDSPRAPLFPIADHDQEHFSLMETAPWRVARRWAATGSAEVPAVMTHSTRSFPTSSRRAATGESGEDEEVGGSEGNENADHTEPAHDEVAETENALFTEEDIRHFDQLPATPTPQECRLLWAGLLEIQDEEAMRADTEEALASNASMMPTRPRLASRHLCRVPKLLQARSTTGLLRLATALPSLLNGIQEAVAEEIEQELHTRRDHKGAKRSQEDDDRGDHREGEDGEEEVEVEGDEECEPPRDETSLMQSGGRPTPKEEAWRPLTRSEKERLARVVRKLLGVQANAEPSLSVLAYIRTPTGISACETNGDNGSDVEVSIGELRPAILRWLGLTPREHVAEAVEVVLGIPGRTHPEPAVIQTIARQLQLEVAADCDPILDQLLRHWSDSADIGIVEELLRIAAEGANAAAIQTALSQLRSARNARKPQQALPTNQRTLPSVWQSMPSAAADGTDWLQQSEDPGTLGVRTQLLGLQQAWSDLSQADRKIILDEILHSLPEDRVKQQADRVAQLYNNIGSPIAPQTIVTLRVRLRQMQQPDRQEEQERDGDCDGGSSSGDTEKESQAQLPAVSSSRRARLTKKRRVSKTSRARLSQQDVKALSTIPRRDQAEASEGTTERAVQTLSRRRQGTWAAKPKSMIQLQHELHGDEHNEHSSRDCSPTPANTRKCTQTSKRRRVKDCTDEADPERTIEDFRQWISPEATTRLAGPTQADRRSHADLADHEATTQLYNPGPRAPRVDGPARQAQSGPLEYEATTQDERQTERFERQCWAQQYEEQRAEEEAEARYLADYQEELDIDLAQEAYDNAVANQYESQGGTEVDGDSDS